MLAWNRALKLGVSVGTVLLVLLLLVPLLPVPLALLLPGLLALGFPGRPLSLLIRSRFRRYCWLFRLGAVPPHGLAHRSQHQGGAIFRTEILGILIDFMTFGTGFHDLLLCFFWGCFA